MSLINELSVTTKQPILIRSIDTFDRDKSVLWIAHEPYHQVSCPEKVPQLRNLYNTFSSLS